MGVSTTEGDVQAGEVVLAAGSWATFCAEWAGLRLPVEPVRGQILALQRPPRGLRHIIWNGGAYLVPKSDGTVVVGATEEHAGYDRRVTAEGVARLLSAAVDLYPPLADATFHHAWSGLRPCAPDRLPVLGPAPGVPGLTLAAGHFRNGVLLSAITGRGIADWLLRGEFPPLFEPFRPERLLSAS